MAYKSVNVENEVERKGAQPRCYVDDSEEDKYAHSPSFIYREMSGKNRIPGHVGSSMQRVVNAVQQSKAA